MPIETDRYFWIIQSDIYTMVNNKRNTDGFSHFHFHMQVGCWWSGGQEQIRKCKTKIKKTTQSQSKGCMITSLKPYLAPGHKTGFRSAWNLRMDKKFPNTWIRSRIESPTSFHHLMKSIKEKLWLVVFVGRQSKSVFGIKVYINRQFCCRHNSFYVLFRFWV